MQWLENLRKTREYEAYRYWFFLLLRDKGEKHYLSVTLMCVPAIRLLYINCPFYKKMGHSTWRGITGYQTHKKILKQMSRTKNLKQNLRAKPGPAAVRK